MNREDIFALNLEGLKTKLDELGLSKTGNKNVLQERLIEHFGLDRADDGSDYGEASSIVAGGTATIPYSAFTIKDVQDSVSSFSGDDLPEIGQWLEEFEDCAYAVKWNDLQKYIYAKQQLIGAAKIFARSESGIRDWHSLKQALSREFGRKMSSLEIHKMLRNRKKKSSESLREYLYVLRDMGSPIRLDEQSLIEYFIDVIGDFKSNKAVLYQSRKLEELKQNISIYEKMRTPETSGAKLQRTKNIPENSKVIKDDKRCFKCGDKGHLSNTCTSAQVKCFNCQAFGHKSFECKVEVKKEKKETTNSAKTGSGVGGAKKSSENVHALSEDIFMPTRRLFKDITVLGKTISALVDTGSDVFEIRNKLLLSLGEFNIESETRTFTGIGGKTISTIGSFVTCVGIDGLKVNLRFHVCRADYILYPIVLGNDIFGELDMIVGSDGV